MMRALDKMLLELKHSEAIYTKTNRVEDLYSMVFQYSKLVQQGQKSQLQATDELIQRKLDSKDPYEGREIYKAFYDASPQNPAARLSCLVGIYNKEVLIMYDVAARQTAEWGTLAELNPVRVNKCLCKRVRQIAQEYCALEQDAPWVIRTPEKKIFQFFNSPSAPELQILGETFREEIAECRKKQLEIEKNAEMIGQNPDLQF